MGNYVRDKDSTPAAVWLCEYAAQLKKENKTLVDALNTLYAQYGFFRNYLTEIRLPGAEGKAQIDTLQASWRTDAPTAIATPTAGTFNVKKVEDYLSRTPIVSETDHASKNVLVVYLELDDPRVAHIKVRIRPSGTEPKMYFEIGSSEFEPRDLQEVQAHIEDVRKRVEIAFMSECYKRIGYEMPERGFLLFSQIPLPDKMRYFEIEPKLLALRSLPESTQRHQEIVNMLSFLGSDPIAKVDAAFKAEHGADIRSYFELS